MEIIEDESFQRLIKNYVGARTSWEFYCFMERIELDSTASPHRRQIGKNTFWYHARTLSFKDTFIQLYKILKNNRSTHDNIYFVGELAKSYCPTKAFMVDQAMQAINDECRIVESVCALRDKVYAHLDRDYKNYLLERSSIPELNQCYYLIEQALISMTSEEFVLGFLDQVPSRDDFKKEFGE